MKIISIDAANNYTFNSLQLNWDDTTLLITLEADSPKTECFLALKCYFEHTDFQCAGLYLTYLDCSNLIYKEKQPLIKLLNLDYAGFIYWIHEKCARTNLSTNSGEFHNIKLSGLELRDLKPVGYPTKLGIEWAAELYIKYTL